MKHLPFCHPGDFDDNGLLKAPVLFWVGLVVMARAWWLMGGGNDDTAGRAVARAVVSRRCVAVAGAIFRSAITADGVLLSGTGSVAFSGARPVPADADGRVRHRGG